MAQQHKIRHRRQVFQWGIWLEVQPKDHLECGFLVAGITRTNFLELTMREKFEMREGIADGGRMQTPAEMTMGELLARYPWAKRALFQKFHIGGCASCGFADSESLAEVCSRNGEATPEKVLEAVHEAHEQDEALMISPTDFQAVNEEFTSLDIRTSEEFEAVHIPGSLHFDQTLMSEVMASWPKDRGILIVDHTGLRALDAAAYFAGHGFSNVRCLRGGIDAYSELVDPTLPRYTLEAA